MKFSKKDLVFSLVTGLITGFSAWRIFEFLNLPRFHGLPWATLVIVVPILWIIGVNLGYLFGRKFAFFNQFGKFAAIGFTNAAVDFGVLNLLIYYSGIANGGWYTLFKAISFISALIPSYFWNKYWAFEAGSSGGGGFEFAKFFGVALVSIFINDGVASLVVNYIHPVLGLDAHAWANISAVVGSAVALIFSFLGFRLAVFRKS